MFTASNQMGESMSTKKVNQLVACNSVNGNIAHFIPPINAASNKESPYLHKVRYTGSHSL